MNKSSLGGRLVRYFPFLALCSLLLALVGCVDKKIFWSPDGNRALLIANGSVLLSDAAGTLTDLKIGQVRNLTWLPDGKRVVLVHERETKDWNLYRPLLDPAVLADVQKAAADLRTEIEENRRPMIRVNLGGEGFRKCVLLCLVGEGGTELRSKLNTKEEAELAEAVVPYYELVSYSVGQSGLEAGTALARFSGQVFDLRPSPSGDALLVSDQLEFRETQTRISLCPITGGQNPLKFKGHTSLFPDWDYAGNSIIFVRGDDESRGKSDQAEFGSLCRQQLRRTKEGKLELVEEAEELAAVVFDPYQRVRSLADGRILFGATEMKLPAAKAELRELPQRFYILDTNRQATLVSLLPAAEERKLPAMVNFFETSPDGRQVLVAGEDGFVCLLDIASGQVQVVQAAIKGANTYMPSWRKVGEFSYFKSNPAVATRKKGEPQPARPFELMLKTEKGETSMSGSWSDEFVSAVGK